jgi:hypothetical protein
MRIGVLVLPIAAALAAAATASAASPASTGYVWAQPGTSLLANPFAQPPSWLETTPIELTVLPVDTAYLWAQPGSAPVSPPDAQPWSL